MGHLQVEYTRTQSLMEAIMPTTDLFLGYTLICIVYAYMFIYVYKLYIYVCIYVRIKTKKTKIDGLSPRANYTDRATAACRKVSANFCG
jgi:hypothetical protein